MTDPPFDPELVKKVAKKIAKQNGEAERIARWHLSELRREELRWLRSFKRVEEERDRLMEGATHREMENFSLKNKLHISENEVINLRLLTEDWIQVLKRIEHIAKPTCGDCTEIEAIANKALHSSNLKELGL